MSVLHWLSDLGFSCLFLLLFERRGGSVLGASDLGFEGLELEPWPVRLRCVLRQNKDT